MVSTEKCRLKDFGEGPPGEGMYMKRLITLTAGAVLILASAAPATAQTVGMVVNQFRSSVIVFDADSDVVLETVVIPGGLRDIFDCSVMADQSLGFVSTFTGKKVWVIDLTGTPALAGGTNPILLSIGAEDTTISPDQQYLLATGLTGQISIVDIANRFEIDTFGTSYLSVEACSDGSVLATDFGNGRVDRLTIDSNGTLNFTGDRLSLSRAINATCAPSATSAVGVTSSFAPNPGQIRSALIPGLGAVDTRSLPGQGISAVVNNAGNQLFVRSTSLPGRVEGFTYNSATGELGAAPFLSFPVRDTSSLFGVDQLALHPSGTKLYVPELSALNVYSASSGDFLTSITDDNMFRPTGVCFAQAVQPPPPAATITKTLNSGPRVVDGGMLVELTGLNTGSNDAGPIDLGRTDAQFYEFVIEITNDGADGTLDGVIVNDVILAEYDLDPKCGDLAISACDLLTHMGDVDRDNDGYADGIINDTPLNCVVTTSTSGGGMMKDGVGLEPEFVDIVLTDDLESGDTCTVRVFVHTDANPRGSLFEPTDCRELDGGIFDTIALNDGVKAFDPVTGDRLLGPVGSLQLTPNHCE